MRRTSHWLIGVLVATLLLSALALANGLCYASVNDALMLKVFAGYQGGVPAHFHPELHTALSWLLCGLQTLFPHVAWLSVLQLSMLWLASAVMVRGLARLADGNGVRWQLGAALGALLCAAIGTYAVCRVDHVATAALLCAAALVQLLCVDFRNASDKQVLGGVLPSVGLMLVGYCFNAFTGLSALCLWLLAAWYVRCGDYSHREVLSRGMAAHKGSRGLLIGLMICLFCFAGFWGVRALELGAMSEYSTWQQARKLLCENPAFPSGVSAAALEAVGWTQAELDAVASGFWYESDLTAEKMTQLASLLPSAPTGLLTLVTRAAQAVAMLWSAKGLGQALLLLCATLAVTGVLAGVLGRRRTSACLLPPLALLVCFGTLGLTPYRAEPDTTQALATLAPACALMLCVAVRSIGAAMNDAGWKKALCVLLCLLAACPLGISAICGGIEAARVTPGDSTFESELAQYALEQPDKLLFYSSELASDTSLFPDLRSVPDNIVLPDARLARTDAATDQLKKFGLNARRLTARVLLGNNVLFAGTQKGPWRNLLAYVQETLTGTYNWASYATQGTLCLYRLCER